jgi:hypothetical protein
MSLLLTLTPMENCAFDNFLPRAKVKVSFKNFEMSSNNEQQIQDFGT